jgi:adenosylhomocysteine nucleosidase
MLGIVVSLPQELKGLTRQPIPIGTWRAITDDTLVALSGIGAERAHKAGAVLVAHGAKALLSWGCAAALNGRISPGCLIIPVRVIGSSGEIYKVNIEWHRRLYKALERKHPVYTEALVESDAVLKTAAEKQALAKRTQAVATDMESAAIARLAQEHGVPFVALRAIVDTVSTDIPDNVLKALDRHGNISVRKLLASSYLVPADWIKIVQLGIQFSAARRTLRKTRNKVLAASHF